MGIVQKIRDLGIENGYSSLAQIEKAAGVGGHSIYRWNKNKPSIERVSKVATLLNVSSDYLLGLTDEKDQDKLIAPNVTDDVVTFPVMGTVAAGYDHVIYEDYTGDSIDISHSALRGHTEHDFFVLRIVGQSMYPQFQEGDFVLVFRQEVMDHFGQVGVVLYEDDKVTLKRVEYNKEKNQMKLVPINPQCVPITIKDEALNHCRILGVPKLLIREIDD